MLWIRLGSLKGCIPQLGMGGNGGGQLRWESLDLECSKWRLERLSVEDRVVKTLRPLDG